MEHLTVDPRAAFLDQLALRAGPIVLINRLQVDPGDEEQLLRCYEADSRFMKAQPGFIYAQLHRGIGDSTTFVNVAVWESTDALRAAVTSDEFRAHLLAYPASASAAPHVFTRVAVPNVCVG
jgi:heme-degrading monooxygenase HmoA